ncbi:MULTISPECIES: PLP-dependent aminotransferase family protein [Marinobacter]|uniref:MocR-like pyridoxine biosynthesis transcription factor PdxR n=1 Tax=Marinobacter TaxID=2742 RepID=UPI0012474211|nr:MULTISPECIES: PLP-dependent aminotransferase family protein [Marinobacter]MBL3555217.1 PLP-dependent aminotransferase family protein [Marinobacter sp. JB05H06]
MIDDIRLEGSAPLQQQLYQQLSQRILRQRYLPGSRLPSSRQMAADLGISRNTVNAVYDQLKAEGFLQSRAGKGVFVHQDIAAAVTPSGPGLEQAIRTTADLPPLPVPAPTNIRTAEDANLPFQPGLPDLDAFPIRSWNRILHHQESRRALRGYDSIQGYLPLRRAIADYLRTSRGVRCEEHQVIITNGAQQALSLIADVFLQAGDRVFCENPGYRGARYAMGRYGNPLVPVPLRNQVLDVGALEALGPAKLLSCTPTHQYPMGGVLDLSQRMALVQWAQRNECWIIEDDYDSEFHFYHKPFAAIQGMFDNAPVLYVGSFSKTLMPALRTGYLVVPEPVIEPILSAKRVSGGETPLLAQATIAEFIDSGQFGRHLRRMRQLYQNKWKRFQQKVTEELAGRVHPVAESAGMHLVLEGTFDDLAVSQWLQTRGFGSTPLSAHFIGKQVQTGLVMGFASASERQMDECVIALKAGLASVP